MFLGRFNLKSSLKGLASGSIEIHLKIFFKSLMNFKLLTLFSLVLSTAVFGAEVLAQAASLEKSYDLELSYANGLLAPKGVVLRDFPALDHRVWPNDGWLCQILGRDGMAIGSFKFSLPVTECRDQDNGKNGLEGGCAVMTAVEFNLSIPYFAQGTAVAVYDPQGGLNFTVDTAKFADMCGDGICAQNENYLVCTRDCRSGVKDGACDKVADGTCDADCNAIDDADCGVSRPAHILWIIPAIGLGVAGFVFWRKRRRVET
jgi:hypothetical protein